MQIQILHSTYSTKQTESKTWMLQQSFVNNMLMRVDGVGECLQVVSDRVEQSLETVNSIVSPFRDIISGINP